VAWSSHPVGLCDAPDVQNPHWLWVSSILCAMYDTYIYKVYLPLLYIGIATMYGNPHPVAGSEHNAVFIENNSIIL